MHEKNFLVFGAPQIEEDEIAEVIASMRSGWLGTGPKVARFEADFAAYKGIPFTAAVNSCTAALHLSILAAGLGRGDEVITTALTFCATINAIIHSGATPVLADVDPHTMNIDPEDIERRITPQTRAIVPVHFAGRPCDMNLIMKIAARHRLKVIEDCAHAIETEYQGRKAGTFGDFGCFSFYVTKNIVTGEGGMVVARESDDIARVKTLALHGLSQDAWSRFRDAEYTHYFVTECGFKYNMMDIQAAMGIHQLKRIEKCWRRREAIWQQYNQAFNTLPITIPESIAPHTRHAYHLYTILLDAQKTDMSRDDFLRAMTAANIGVGVHYFSIPEHPYYQETYGWRPEDYPHAMQIGRQTVSLPISPKLTDEDVNNVIQAVTHLIIQ